MRRRSHDRHPNASIIRIVTASNKSSHYSFIVAISGRWMHCDDDNDSSCIINGVSSERERSDGGKKRREVMHDLVESSGRRTRACRRGIFLAYRNSDTKKVGRALPVEFQFLDSPFMDDSIRSTHSFTLSVSSIVNLPITPLTIKRTIMKKRRVCHENED